MGTVVVAETEEQADRGIESLREFGWIGRPEREGDMIVIKLSKMSPARVSAEKRVRAWIEGRIVSL